MSSSDSSSSSEDLQRYVQRASPVPLTSSGRLQTPEGIQTLESQPSTSSMIELQATISSDSDSPLPDLNPQPNIITDNSTGTDDSIPEINIKK